MIILHLQVQFVLLVASVCILQRLLDGFSLPYWRCDTLILQFLRFISGNLWHRFVRTQPSRISRDHLLGSLFHIILYRSAIIQLPLGNGMKELQVTPIVSMICVFLLIFSSIVVILVCLIRMLREMRKMRCLVRLEKWYHRLFTSNFHSRRRRPRRRDVPDTELCGKWRDDSIIYRALLGEIIIRFDQNPSRIERSPHAEAVAARTYLAGIRFQLKR